MQDDGPRDVSTRVLGDFHSLKKIAAPRGFHSFVNFVYRLVSLRHRAW